MIKKLKQIIAVPALLAMLFVPVFSVSTAGAQSIRENLCSGTDFQGVGEGSCQAADTGSAGVQTVVNNIVNWLSWIVGVISVIMIIVGGFRYITSGGASDKVTSAKNTIIYAIIGLVIVALAQFIVKFVIGQAIEIG